MILREIPLYRSDPALVSQRKLALYGVRARTIPEDQVEKDLKTELQDLLPEVFRGTHSVVTECYSVLLMLTSHRGGSFDAQVINSS